MRQGLRLDWSTEAMWEIFSCWPKYSSASSWKRMILKPQATCLMSSSQQKVVAAGLSVEVWGPRAMPTLIKARGQSSLASAGNPFAAYYRRRNAAGWVSMRGAWKVWC